jgi:signal transduction histidine kinase
VSLRPIDLFDDLSDAELAEWEAVAHEFTLQPGDLLADPARPSHACHLLLEGTVQGLLVDGDRTEPAGKHVAPTWMGAIAVLTGGVLGVRLVAETACRLARIEEPDFRRLAFAMPAVHDRVMRQVGPVMSRITAIEQNRERLAALGTMAAGLAHELNNPAAAARSAATQLVETLDTVNSTLRIFVEAGVERDEAEQLLRLQREAMERAASQTALDALDAADAEDDLRDKLEDLGIAEAWRLAEPLAAAGLDDAWLQQVIDLAGPAADAALRWVAATLTAHGLATELEESTDRMSKLVGSVKSYAYMDRGELVEVDIHEGLETTIAVLGHKLKHTEIKLDRAYDKALPKLTVRGSELNQVWTNLLDNAIDALGDRGTIRVRTRRDGDCAEIAIGDDGPGIPPAVREHLFDPFFTTKDVGHGTGLGLATARRIVVDRHDGSLTVDSRPGDTVFTVRLPLSRNGST